MSGPWGHACYRLFRLQVRPLSHHSILHLVQPWEVSSVSYAASGIDTKLPSSVFQTAQTMRASLFASATAARL
jgi:hypothetical protein